MLFVLLTQGCFHSRIILVSSLGEHLQVLLLLGSEFGTMSFRQVCLVSRGLLLSRQEGVFCRLGVCVGARCELGLVKSPELRLACGDGLSECSVVLLALGSQSRPHVAVLF